MKRQLIGLGALAVSSLATAYVMATGGAVATRALVVEDLGVGYDQTVAHMEQATWVVEPVEWTALIKQDGAALRAAHEVIWILPDADYDSLRQLSARDGVLERFAEAGGVVVMVGVDAAQHRLDVAPGGLDAFCAQDSTVVITAPTHAIITGEVPGGTPLTEAALDPSGAGGGGTLANAPAGCSPVTIAENGSGACFCEYQVGDGRVIVSTLDLLDGGCLCNVLHHVGSVTQ